MPAARQDLVRKKLGELLIEAGLISPYQLQSALAQQRSWGGRLGSNLVRLGYIGEADLAGFLGRQLKVPFVDLTRHDAAPHVVKLIPLALAEKYLIFPIELRDKRLAVAMTDPSDLAVVEEVQFVTGYRIDPVVALESSIREAIDRYYKGKTPIARQWATKEQVDIAPPSPEIRELERRTREALAEARDRDRPREEKEREEGQVPLPRIVHGLVKLLIEKKVITKEDLFRIIKELP